MPYRDIAPDNGMARFTQTLAQMQQQINMLLKRSPGDMLTPDVEAIQANLALMASNVSAMQAASVADPVWTPVSGYANNWGPTTITGQQAPQLSKTTSGWVHLRGMIRNSSGWLASQIATIPTGYRPSATEGFPIAGMSNTFGPASGVLTIDSSGVVSLIGTTSAWSATNWFSLSGITYRLA